MSKRQQLLFKINDLSVWFPVTKGFFKKTVGHVKAVDGVNLEVYKGETLGIVGESGCGKTTLGKAILGLEAPTKGEVLFFLNDAYQNIYGLSGQELLQYKKEVNMVFQDPYSALNPLKKIFESLSDPLIVHGVRNKTQRAEIITSAIEKVNMQPDYLMRYPHEFSGGQRQRICIARALEVKPSVIIADEPVSALDVSIQAQILNLMKQIQKETNITYIFIAHDLSVVQYMSDRIIVMYLGNIVEQATSKSLYEKPLHPYTQALLSAVPVPDIHTVRERIILKGEIPSPINKPSGCPFHTRCPFVHDICKETVPLLKNRSDKDHFVACHLYNDNPNNK